MPGRRGLLQAGVCGALGLSLHDLFGLQAAEDPVGAKAVRPRAQSVIQINLPGGLPQHESFDPKPEAQAACRGPFGVVKTKTGEVFSDMLPKLAQISDKLAVIRTVVGKIPDHAQATYHLLTGYTPTAAIDYPTIGSVVSHELGPRGDLPPFIAIPTMTQPGGGTGFLGSMYGAFEVGGDPGQIASFRVSGCSLPDGISSARLDRRYAGREVLEQRIRALEGDRAVLDTMGDFYARAYTMLTSSQVRAAFSMAEESPATIERYGNGMRTTKGQPTGLAGRLILARRMVEAGVRFVTVTYGSWDCHVDVRQTCLDQLPALDQGLAALISDLDERGLLDSTLVMLTTEFGRTPMTNASSGRDHWARTYSMMLAGGGVAKGVTHGVTDATAAEPVRDAVPLEDFLFTIYHLLGIDASKRLLAFGTRPIDIIRDGRLVPGLIS